VLVLYIHREGSAFGNLRLIRWILETTSSTQGRILFFAFAFVCSGSNAASSAIVRGWLMISRILRSFAILVKLLLREYLFNSQAWFGRHKQFFADFALKCLVNFIEYFIYHLLARGLGRFIWGSEAYTWLNRDLYLLQALWLLCRNTYNKYQEYRWMSPRRPSPQTPEPAPCYSYASLSADRNIRLPLLHPRHPSAPVTCSLFETPLGETPCFEAMSYTWGDKTKDFSILAGGLSIPVTANAYNLLRDMSSYLLPRLLWIDSICITQDDEAKKSKLVQLMETIYRRASLVTGHSIIEHGARYPDGIRGLYE
jgi:hypothetical protein